MTLQQLKKNKLYRKTSDVVWRIWYKLLSIQYIWKPKKELLIYLGINRGMNLDRIYWKYKKIIGIEADPEIYKFLQIKYKNKLQIELIHGAAASKDGFLKLNIAGNDGQSSSLGTFKKDFLFNTTMQKQVVVPSYNIGNLLQKRGVEFITDYISDIQGMDLEVLKTMNFYIENKKIECIVSEVAKNEKGNIYDGIPDNSFNGFEKLLNKNYNLNAKGIGLLKQGKFDSIPDEYWEMDCMWKLK
jgi:FkbM family methyltransferase